MFFFIYFLHVFSLNAKLTANRLLALASYLAYRLVCSQSSRLTPIKKAHENISPKCPTVFEGTVQ